MSALYPGFDRTRTIAASLVWLSCCFCTFFSTTCFSVPAVISAQSSGAHTHNLNEIHQFVSAASKASPQWSGPLTGPMAVADKTIAIIAEDLRNGGILGVARGVMEAAELLGWQVEVFDAEGSSEGRIAAATKALAINPDGLILNGADADIMRPWLSGFVKRGMPIVGWHVGPKAGEMESGPVAVNISTDCEDVANIIAMAAISESDGRAGVVIFTDSNFAIAMNKAKIMADIIASCSGCTLLETLDIPISDAASMLPDAINDLLSRYGKRWTHGLAINDIYFDYAVPEFILAGTQAEHIRLLSAGDGSGAAFQRIEAGIYQTGTVAEPLNLHGWQLMDELNRLFHHKPVSGFVAPVHLTTQANINYDDGQNFRYDPDNGYRVIYRKIWRK